MLACYMGGNGGLGVVVKIGIGVGVGYGGRGWFRMWDGSVDDLFTV